MADEEGTRLGTGSTSRDWGKAGIVLLIAGAVVLATGITPALGSLTGGAPASQFVPVPGDGVPSSDTDTGDGYDVSESSGVASGAGASGSGGSQLGALSAGQRTGVGGSLSDGNGSVFQSLNDEVHFVVRADRPAYWRTNAYDEYTGGGWTQTGNPDPYTAPIRDRPAGERLSYSVELRQAATTLPTAWTPQRVDIGTDLFVTPTTAVLAEEPVPAGTRYEGASYQPVRDPAVLRASGTDAPDQIQERFTQLPDASEEALTPFVSNLTTNATSDYKVATRIESWLETEKTYSLSVSEPPTNGIARQFVFEMEKGYCEYFATSMTAMLRSQGIPARYVVGYSPGEKTGPNEYTVRAMNAHAWVEVYFDGVGWVRFDPTPGSERRNAEADAFASQSGGQYQPATASGSPTDRTDTNDTDDQPSSTEPTTDNETPSTTTTTAQPNATTTTTTAPSTTTATTTTTTTTTTTGGEPTNETDTDPDAENSTDSETSEPAPLDVQLSRSPVPGANVTVTVTRGNETVSGATVYFNDLPVGVTDTNGTVTASVPYTDELNVTVREEGGRQSNTAGGFGTAPQFSTVPGGNNTTATYSLTTTADVAVLGRSVTGSEVSIVATIDGVPVRNGTILLAGERVGETNQAGRATISLPTEPGPTVVEVRRGAIAGNTTVALPELSVSAQSGAPLTLPFSTVVVETSLNGSGVAGVPIRVNGELVGETGPDGELKTRLPLAETATIRAAKFGQRRTTELGGLYKNTGLVGAAVCVLGVGVLYGKRRSGLSSESLPHAVARAVSALVRWIVAVVLFVVSAITAWISRVLAAVKNAIVAVGATLRGQLAPRVLAERFVAWLEAVRERARATTQRLQASVARVTDRFRGEDTTTQSDYRTFRDAWELFLGHVSLRRPHQHTPGEIAAYAIERDGLPTEAVETLRDEFRAIEYGHHDPSVRLEHVETAAQQVEAAVDPDDDEDAAEPDRGDA